MNVEFKPIQHVTNPALVKRKIHQASSAMFIREFLQNAIEAARYAKHPRVKWYEEKVGSHHKLMIWNNGRGMDPSELRAVMDLGASGGEKVQSAGENFGLGAKLTGLKANHLGLLWRTCNQERVSQLWLGWENGEPGMIPQGTENEQSLILDMSHEYASMTLKAFDHDLWAMSGKPSITLLEFDWTMVVFLGNQESQDTVVDPFGNGKPVGGAAYWLTKQINRRYYDLDKYNVTAVCNRVRRSSIQSRKCQGLYHLEALREESVSFSKGRLSGLIRYALLPEELHDQAEQAKGYGPHVALVFKNEIYDGHFEGAWALNASRFGITAGHQRIAIQIVLNDSCRLTPNEQRMTLEEEEDFGERRPLYVGQFEEETEILIPPFVKEFIDTEDAKRIKTSPRFSQKVRKLMENMGLKALRPSENHPHPIGNFPPDGDAPAQPELTPPPKQCAERPAFPRVPTSDVSSKPSVPSPITKRPFGNVFGRGGTPILTGAVKHLTNEPQIVWNPETGKAIATVGYFDDNHNKLYLHEDYPVLKQVIAAALAAGISPKYRQQVVAESRDAVSYAALRHVLYAKAMLKSNAINADQFKNATSPESLTASVGYHEMHADTVRLLFRGRMTPK